MGQAPPGSFHHSKTPSDRLFRQILKHRRVLDRHLKMSGQRFVFHPDSGNARSMALRILSGTACFHVLGEPFVRRFQLRPLLVPEAFLFVPPGGQAGPRRSPFWPRRDPLRSRRGDLNSFRAISSSTAPALETTVGPVFDRCRPESVSVCSASKSGVLLADRLLELPLYLLFAA